MQFSYKLKCADKVLQQSTHSINSGDMQATQNLNVANRLPVWLSMDAFFLKAMNIEVSFGV